MLCELCELLREQKNILTDLLVLTREEQRVIISGESDKLENLVRLEFKELSKLGAVEKKRTALNKVVSMELGLQDSSITVSAIVQNAMPDEREVLKTLQVELTALIDEHARVNMQNRELINSHLEYSGAMMELMTEPEDPLNNFYGGDGREALNKKKSSGLYNGQA